MEPRAIMAGTEVYLGIALAAAKTLWMDGEEPIPGESRLL